MVFATYTGPVLIVCQIMDAKMDSGFVPPGDSLEITFDPCQMLDDAQVIWIMDQLLCLEVRSTRDSPVHTLCLGYPHDFIVHLRQALDMLSHRVMY